jgi:3-dehydroshikimate dehydratase
MAGRSLCIALGLASPGWVIALEGTARNGPDPNEIPGLHESGTDPREVLVVNRATDDNDKGSLRWAITQSNRAPGKYKILFETVAEEPLVIRPRTLLPPIVGPAFISGPWHGGSFSANVIIDGSPLLDMSEIAGRGSEFPPDWPWGPRVCPGETSKEGYGPNAHSLKNPALAVVDTHDVEIEGIEIRDFCIGILSLRSHHVNIHHDRFENNLGAAAVVLTGDNGKNGGTVAGASHDNTIEYNYFLNNSDTIDVVRGDMNSKIRFNTLVIDGTGQAVPSSGVEVSETNSGTLIEGNFFSGFADAIQINKSRVPIPYPADFAVLVIRNTMTRNTVGVSVGGSQHFLLGNRIYGNRTGIGVRAGGTGNTLSQNAVYDNGKDFSSCGPGDEKSGVCLDRHWSTTKVTISLNYPLGTAQTAGDLCNDGRQGCPVQNSPVIDRAAWMLTGVIAEGHLDSRPNQSFVIEFFFSDTAGPGGLGEAGEYVGAIKVSTNTEGIARFALPPAKIHRENSRFNGDTNIYLTATATSASSRSTSELSSPVLISPPP